MTRRHSNVKEIAVANDNKLEVNSVGNIEIETWLDRKTHNVTITICTTTKN